MTLEQISLALVCVVDLSDAASRGDVAECAQARRALNELCLEWNDGRSYPPAIRQALRECNLRTQPAEKEVGK